MLKDDRFQVMPWKNGFGTTKELVKVLHEPQNGPTTSSSTSSFLPPLSFSLTVSPIDVATSEQSFLYRISIATVSQAAPFSNFNGYDRVIMLLEGNGTPTSFQSILSFPSASLLHLYLQILSSIAISFL